MRDDNDLKFINIHLQLSVIDSFLGPNIGLTISFLVLLVGFPKYVEKIRAPQTCA